MAFTISIVRIGGRKAKNPLATIPLPEGASTLDALVAAVAKAKPGKPAKTKTETKGEYIARLIRGPKPWPKPTPPLSPLPLRPIGR